MKKTRLFSVVTLALILCTVPLTIVSGVYDSSYNNVAIPLSNYPATQGDGWGRPAVLSRFTTRYGDSNQCDGFARYAHDQFWHMDERNWDGWFWTTSHNDYYGPQRDGYSNVFPIPLNNASDVESFFRSINRGAFVRLLSQNEKNIALEEIATDTGKKGEALIKGSHSIFFDGINSEGTGFYAYECNLDGNNGVHYQEYTFSQFYGQGAYVEVIYYVDHTLSSQKTPHSLAYHKEECVNCDGYLLQPHNGTTTPAHYDINQHKVTISCCGYEYYEAHTFDAGLRCTKCRYLKGSSVNKLDPELETG